MGNYISKPLRINLEGIALHPQVLSKIVNPVSLEHMPISIKIFLIQLMSVPLDPKS